MVMGTVFVLYLLLFGAVALRVQVVSVVMVGRAPLERERIEIDFHGQFRFAPIHAGAPNGARGDRHLKPIKCTVWSFTAMVQTCTLDNECGFLFAN